MACTEHSRRTNRLPIWLRRRWCLGGADFLSKTRRNRLLFGPMLPPSKYSTHDVFHSTKVQQTRPHPFFLSGAYSSSSPTLPHSRPHVYPDPFSHFPSPFPPLACPFSPPPSPPRSSLCILSPHVVESGHDTCITLYISMTLSFIS